MSPSRWPLGFLACRFLFSNFLKYEFYIICLIILWKRIVPLLIFFFGVGVISYILIRISRNDKQKIFNNTKGSSFNKNLVEQ